MGGESRPSSPIGAQANHKSNSSYNKRPINDVDDRLYDTYNEQSVIESNPMLQKRRDALSPLKLQAQ